MERLHKHLISVIMATSVDAREEGIQIKYITCKPGKKDGSMKKRFAAVSCLLAGMMLLNACTPAKPGGLSAQEKNSLPAAVNEAKPADDAQGMADIPKSEQSVYLIIKNDLANYQITLMNLSSHAQICYEYTDGTEFFDKYGDYTPGKDFSEGKLAVIKRLNSNDTLGAIAFTDATWAYEDVRNYNIDAQRNRISIADTSYHFDDELRVFSNGEETGIHTVGDRKSVV